MEGGEMTGAGEIAKGGQQLTLVPISSWIYSQTGGKKTVFQIFIQVRRFYNVAV